nr:protein SPIRAL1-like 1 [Equus asinus]
MGGEGKGGGERAVRSLPGERPPRPQRSSPTPSSPPAPAAPHPRALARAARAHPAPPAAAQGAFSSGQLYTSGPRPADALGTPGQSEPVHSAGGRDTALRDA